MAWGAPGMQGGDVYAQSRVAPKSAYQTALDNYMGFAGPSLQQNQIGQNADYRNIGYSGIQYGLDANGQQLAYQSQLGDLGAQMGNNAIDQQAAARLGPYYDALMGMSDKSFWNSAIGASQTAQHDQSILHSNVSAAGATTSRGFRDDKKFINDQLANQLTDFGLANDKTQLTLQEQKAQAADRQKQLAIEAANLGTKPEILRSQLENGLAKLGLQNTMTVDDLLDGIAKKNLDSLNIYYQAIQSAGQYATAKGGG